MWNELGKISLEGYLSISPHFNYPIDKSIANSYKLNPDACFLSELSVPERLIYILSENPEKMISDDILMERAVFGYHDTLRTNIDRARDFLDDVGSNRQIYTLDYQHAHILARRHKKPGEERLINKSILSDMDIDKKVRPLMKWLLTAHQATRNNNQFLLATNLTEHETIFLGNLIMQFPNQTHKKYLIKRIWKDENFESASEYALRRDSINRIASQTRLTLKKEFGTKYSIIGSKKGFYSLISKSEK